MCLLLSHCNKKITQQSKAEPLASLGNVFCHKENSLETGHYGRVTLFWLRHWLICACSIGPATWLTRAGTTLLSTTRGSSVSLCQGQLQRCSVAIQQTTAPCIQYQQAEKGEMANLSNNMTILQQTRGVLAHGARLIGVRMTIWMGELL